MAAATGPDPAFDELYRELILDHYRIPRNRRALDAPNVDLTQHNPVCGDEIQITAQVENGHLVDIGFMGQGCSISQASASMMTEIVKGKRIEVADGTAASFRSMLRGETEGEESLGDLLSLQGVSKYPIRVKCAVLAWDTLQKGLEAHLKVVP